MVSPELIRRYPYFAGLTNEEILTLAKVADEISVEKDYYFFHEGEPLDYIYLIIEGGVAIIYNLPQKKKELTISTLGAGEVFGWSGLLAPYIATAGAKSISPCRVLTFDCKILRQKFDEDCHFGYLMMSKIAQVIRDRLRDFRIESLAFLSD